jgi:hypothetical protein
VAVGAVDPYALADQVLVPLRVVDRTAPSAGVAARDRAIPAIAPGRPAALFIAQTEIDGALTLSGVQADGIGVLLDLRSGPSPAVWLAALHHHPQKRPPHAPLGRECEDHPPESG